MRLRSASDAQTALPSAAARDEEAELEQLRERVQAALVDAPDGSPPRDARLRQDLVDLRRRSAATPRFEPANREADRAAQLEFLAAQGSDLYASNCSSCHGIDGEGGIGPALNSQQFLEAANNEQISALIAVGVPGSQMSAYSQDFAGPLTSEQIKAITTFMRSWEEDAPDRPDWRNPTLGDGG